MEKGRKYPLMGDVKMEYSITYSSFDEDSLEVGESLDSGYEVEPEVETMSEILHIAYNDYGIYSPVSIGRWESTVPLENRDYFEKGISKYFNLHIKNEDGTEISEEVNDFITLLLSEGRFNRDYFSEYFLGGLLGGNDNSNSGRSWTLDHYQHNKKESYEVPMSKRKKAMGGTAEDRREVIQLRIDNLNNLLNVMSDDKEINQMKQTVASLERERDAMKYADGGETSGYKINEYKGTNELLQNSGEIITPLIWVQSKWDKGTQITSKYRYLNGDTYQFWDNFGGALFIFSIESITPHSACELAIERIKYIFRNGIPQKRGETFIVSGIKFNEINDIEDFTPSFMTGTHIRNPMGDGSYQSKKGDLLRFDDNGEGFDFYYLVDNTGKKVSDVRLKGAIFSSLFGQGIIQTQNKINYEDGSFEKGGFINISSEYADGGRIEKVFVAQTDGILGIYSGSDAYSIEISKGDKFITFGNQDDNNWWYVKMLDDQPKTMMENNTFDYNKNKSRVNIKPNDLILTFPRGDKSIYAEMKEVFADGGGVKKKDENYNFIVSQIERNEKALEKTYGTERVEQLQKEIQRLKDKLKNEYDVKYANGGGLEGNSNRKETQENPYAFIYRETDDPNFLAERYSPEEVEDFINDFNKDFDTNYKNWEEFNKGEEYRNFEPIMLRQRKYADGGEAGKQDWYDFDKKMALINLDQIHEYAVKLDKIITEKTKLEDWVKMKITRVEQSMADVKKSLEGWEKFSEGGELVKKQLLHIAKYSKDLLNMVQKGSKLMSWQEGKLAVASEYIDNVYHHLDYQVGNRASDGKYAIGGTVSEQKTYLDNRIKNLNMILRMANEDKKQELRNSISELERERDELPQTMKHGGMVDLFEDYKNIPPKIKSILDEYSEDFEDGNYDGLKKALTKVEAKGYTFEYGLDGSAYGLRPKGVKLNELKGYKDMAKGGGVKDISYEEILNVLKESIDDSIQELPIKYEQSENFKGEEVESKSRDGFMAFTNGGYEATWFEYISQFNGSGNSLPTAQLDKEMQRQVDYQYGYAKDRFKDEYPEIVEKLGEENIDYNSLYDAGYESEAEQLSEWEMDYDGEDSIMCEIGAYYYDTENYRGIEGEHTIRLFGVVNLESPYHRRGNLEDSYDIDITFNSIKELKEKVTEGLKEIISWFDGEMYNDSKSELSIKRMKDGGEADYSDYEFEYGDKLDLGSKGIKYFKEYDGEKIIVVDSKSDLKTSKGSSTYPSSVKKVLNKKYADGGGVSGKLSYEDFVETLRDNDRINAYTGRTTRGMEIYYLPSGHPFFGMKFTHKNKRKAYNEYLKVANNMANGGGVEGHKHVLHIDGQNWFLEKIDSTHFYMSNDRNYRGMAHHIGQHKGEPYYEEVREWLKSTYDDGGGVGELPSNLKKRLENANKIIKKYNGRELTEKEAIRFNIDHNSQSGFQAGEEAFNLAGVNTLKNNPTTREYNTIGDALIDISRKMTGVEYDLKEYQIQEILKSKRNQFADGGSMYAEGGEVEEWMNDALKELRDYTDNNSLKIENVYDDDYFLASDGSEEYMVFEDFDEAHEYAVDDVKNNLEENPEYFQRDWLMGHLEAGNFFRDIFDEWNMSYATDIMTEDDDNYPNRLVAEMVEWGLMDNDEAKGEDAEEIANDRMSDFVNALTEDQINQGNDGFTYYIDNFGEEEAFQMALKQGLIDIEGASEDAVNMDGVAHFISSYDGEEIALDGGSYAYRIN